MHLCSWLDRTRIRSIGLCAALAFTLLPVLRIYFVARHVIPVRVSGNSMVPTLMGDHVQAYCDDCGFSLKVELQGEAATPIGCPNCLGTRVRHMGLVQADRVLIDRWKLRQKNPDRGDLVALSEPDETNRLAVKRVMGLPGERVEIRDGILYCNGEAVAAKTRFPVNDDSYRSGGVSRWRPVHGDAWKQTEDGFMVRPQVGDNSVHWLTYHHLNAVQGTDAGKIYDDIPFNRTVRRSLNDCRNVSVEGQALLQGSGRLLLKYEIGESSWILDYNVSNKTARIVHGRASKYIQFFSSDRFRFRIERLDNEILFSIDGEVEARCRIEDAEIQPRTGRCFIGTVGLPMTLSDLLVKRLGYISIDAPEPVTTKCWQLGDDEYFLLGDNSPVSRDSRHWRAIKKSDLVGFVRRF